MEALGLQQFYLAMRMNSMAIRDILRKREKNARNQMNETVPLQTHNPFATGKEICIEALVEKLSKLKVSKITKCDLSMDEKNAIIEYISERQQSSFNRHTLSALMTVWRIPDVYELDLMEETLNSSSKDHGVRKIPKNYFVLSGKIKVFREDQVKIERQPHKNKIFNLASGCGEGVFETEAIYEIDPDLAVEVTPANTVEENMGWGPLFKKKDERKNICLVAVNAVIVEIKHPEFESLLFNLGGMDQDKKAKIIEFFPVFSSIGKKIHSILPYIELKHYTRNEKIYRERQMPEAVYLVIKGEVIFQMKIYAKGKETDKEILNMNESSRHQSDMAFHTETLGVSNYFGEQEVINKCQRKQTAVCFSAQCELLEIPIEKFEKLLSNSDFYHEIQANSKLKIQKREEKVEKAINILGKMSQQSRKDNTIEGEKEQREAWELGSKVVRKKRTMEAPRVMHGNVIKKVRANNSAEQVKFSMLEANPDMWMAIKKKYRKFEMKPSEKLKADVNWNLKRVWKVLNLENVLREDVEVASPEGRKFYESHRRYQNHVSEVKSLRPKTSSSTYRTKLQYIAYLQQFNN